jgi:L,D-peptidoglycan transpeptidase YkuD (ErfK/YbiS/YcfS/YnhG family)
MVWVNIKLKFSVISISNRSNIMLVMNTNANKIVVHANGTLGFNGNTYKCALGKRGVGVDKIEGDGKTPVGTYPLRLVYYRPDKIGKVDTNLPIKALGQSMGWSDDVSKSDYNQEVSLPYEGSHESLWRPDDDLYDLIVVIGYNDDPPVAGKGSAIFMHVARPAFTPTAGCVALSKPDLLEILSLCNTSTTISIQE